MQVCASSGSNSTSEFRCRRAKSSRQPSNAFCRSFVPSTTPFYVQTGCSMRPRAASFFNSDICWQCACRLSRQSRSKSTRRLSNHARNSRILSDPLPSANGPPWTSKQTRTLSTTQRVSQDNAQDELRSPDLSSPDPVNIELSHVTAPGQALKSQRDGDTLVNGQASQDRSPNDLAIVPEAASLGSFDLLLSKEGDTRQRQSAAAKKASSRDHSSLRHKLRERPAPPRWTMVQDGMRMKKSDKGRGRQTRADGLASEQSARGLVVTTAPYSSQVSAKTSRFKTSAASRLTCTPLPSPSLPALYRCAQVHIHGSNEIKRLRVDHV